MTDQKNWWPKKHFYADPEGQHVFMAQGDGGTGIDMWAVPGDGSGTPRRLILNAYSAVVLRQ